MLLASLDTNTLTPSQTQAHVRSQVYITHTHTLSLMFIGINSELFHITSYGNSLLGTELFKAMYTHKHTHTYTHFMAVFYGLTC